MIPLSSFIFESKLQNAEWEKHNYQYSKAVVDKLISGQQIRLGANGGDEAFIANNEEISQLKNLDVTNSSPADFNLIFNGRLKWNQIFKGDFTGYTNGLASKNKGNAFEDDFVNNFEKYRSEMESELGLDLSGYIPVSRGAENQARPLVKNGKNIILSSSHPTVGESVVDVELQGKNSINLSLKWGNTVTFCNPGIKRLFPNNMFNEYKKTGEFNPTEYNGVSSKDLLDMFSINYDKFMNTFVNYGKKQDDHEVDITKQLKDNDLFFNFLESVIGYNYILVHQINKTTHYVNLLTKKDMNKLIGNNIKDATIYYGGKDGKGKRVDIEVNLDNLYLKFNIRSKDGGLYPTHIMADYKIKH